jgi:hypothetical protein
MNKLLISIYFNAIMNRENRFQPLVYHSHPDFCEVPVLCGEILHPFGINNLQIPLPASPPHIDFYFPCYEILTNPSFRKPFRFTSMQNPRGVASFTYGSLCELCASVASPLFSAKGAYCRLAPPAANP